MKRVHHFNNYDEFELFSAQHDVVNYNEVETWARRFGTIMKNDLGFVVLRDTVTKECKALHYMMMRENGRINIIIGVHYGWALLHVERILNKISQHQPELAACPVKATFFCEADKQPEGMRPSAVVFTNKFGKEWAFKRPSQVLDMCVRRFEVYELSNWLDTVGQEHGMVTAPYELMLNFDYEMTLASKGFMATRYMFDYSLR